MLKTPCVKHSPESKDNLAVKEIFENKPVAPGPYRFCSVCRNWIHFDKINCKSFVDDTYWY